MRYNDSIGAVLTVLLVLLSVGLGWLSRPIAEPPTVTLEPIRVTAPRCRPAGSYPLYNQQKDSVASLLICKKGPTFLPQQET